ncbi:MAG: transglutaminase-like domain-containing protein [Nocardioides sp.]
MRFSPPTRATWVDAGVLLVLTAVVLVGLAPTYQGNGYLVVGLVGAVIGVGSAIVTRGFGWPAIATVLIVLAAFYLLGGPLCLRGEGAGAPGPSSAHLLTQAALFGWKDLLTTLPPLDAGGPLLVLPFVMGQFFGMLGALLAGADRGPLWFTAPLPLLAPLGLLALVILLGIHRPQSLWVEGVLVAVLSLCWLILRHARRTGAVHGSTSRVPRVVAGAGLVALAALVALPVGTWASGGDGNRVILRTYVAPPLDVGQYPSPLASFRRYVQQPKKAPQNLHDTTLFTVTGVPAGTRVRIATLDRYDGSVYGASNGTEPGPVDDTFQRVSSKIDSPVTGRSVSGTLTLGPGYSGVWLPTVGDLTELHFRSGDVDTMEQSFRYNLATATGVVPTGLTPGDGWEFSGVEPDESLTSRDEPGDPLVDASTDGGFLDTQAVTWSEGASRPMERLFAIARHLKRDGKYSDGAGAAEQIYHPGHNQYRLSDDAGGLNSRVLVGDDEQYAAWMALLANRIGVPARVVFGAVTPASGVVRGRDVHAWVEVRVADDSWRTLPTSAFMSRDKPAAQPPQSEQRLTGAVVPPPQPLPPPSSVGDQADTNLRAQKSKKAAPKPPAPPPAAALRTVTHWVSTVLTYGGVPVLVIVLLLGAVVGLKALRRRRRRRAGRVSSRFVGGWHELVDHARDLGQPIPVTAGVTRREQSRSFATSTSAPVLARRADSQVFGPRAPEADAAAAYWREINSERRAMSTAVGRRQRIRAALSLTSLRRPR